MLRVRFSALLPDKDGKLHYRGVPFSGLAYPVADDGIVASISIVTDGVVTGTSTDWILLPPNGARVDQSFLEELEDYGPQLWGGMPFTGVSYYFVSSGECVRETEYAGGREAGIVERAWYRTGEPRELIAADGYDSWLENGKRKQKTEKGIVLYNLITGDDGRLGGIILRDPALFDLDTVAAMTLADRMLLKGNAIDTDLLRRLCDATRMDLVPAVELIETTVDSAAVSIIVSLGALQMLQFQSSLAFRLEDARDIKRQRPSCVVSYDGSTL